MGSRADSGAFFEQHRQRFVHLESAGGGVGELESEQCNTASSLLLASRKRLVSCSISNTGRQLSIAKQRRQSGSVET